MLVCQKCGNDNPLGRVFCGNCGTKLDLSNMTQDVVSEAVRVNWFMLHWRKFVAGAVAVLALMGILALIPNAGTIGEGGTLGGGRRVENLLRQLGQLQSGRTVSASFDEKDINGYFEFIKNRNLADYEQVSMDVGIGYVRVHLEKTLFSLTVFGMDWQPKMTYELMCVPGGAGGVVARKATVGRLPLSGPLRTRLIRRLRAQIAEQKDWAGLNYLTKVNMKDNTIHVEARR